MKPTLVNTADTPPEASTVEVDMTMSMTFSIIVSTDGESVKGISTDHLTGVKIFKTRVEKIVKGVIQEIIDKGGSVDKGDDYENSDWNGPEWESHVHVFPKV